jgi:hypothetical protein
VPAPSRSAIRGSFCSALRAADAVLLAQVVDSNGDVTHTSFLPRITRFSLRFLCHELTRIFTKFFLHLPHDGGDLREIGVGTDEVKHFQHYLPILT